MCVEEITVVSGGVEYALSYETRQTLDYILKFGPIYERALADTEGVRLLLSLGLVSKIIVEACREKIAATPTGLRIHDKMDSLSIKTDLGLNTTSEYLGMTTTVMDLNLEVMDEVENIMPRIGENKT